MLVADNFLVSLIKRFLRTMRGMQGALMVASILPMLLGFLGIWRIVVRCGGAKILKFGSVFPAQYC